jgi:4-carboxymuconolactone decarboxylase
MEYLKVYVEYRDVLRRLAIGDISFGESILCDQSGERRGLRLDARSVAFARLGALVAMGATPSAYQSQVDEAFAAGASTEEIVRLLIAVAPTVGLARVMTAAPALGLAAGYDTEAALEALDAE